MLPRSASLAWSRFASKRPKRHFVAKPLVMCLGVVCWSGLKPMLGMKWLGEKVFLESEPLRLAGGFKKMLSRPLPSVAGAKGGGSITCRLY